MTLLKIAALLGNQFVHILCSVLGPCGVLGMNTMTETRRLLREYVEAGSESAFRELVEGYIGLVYSTALRLVAEDAHRAEDVTQMVFVRLTHKAKTLDKEVSLGGWLHRDTCHVAATLMRGERRRQIREREAVEMNALSDEPDSNLTHVLPILDEAINELGNEDREAIMLRFFEQQSFRAVGEIVGSSEDAARMRVNRALDKLQGLLRARGVAAVSVGALTTILGAKAVNAAPIGLAASVVKGLGASATGGGASSPAVARPLAKSLKMAFVPVAAVVLMLSVGIYAEHRVGQKTASTSALAITNATEAAASPATVPADLVSQGATPTTANVPTNIMTLHVVDAASGAPLNEANVRVVYFASSAEKEVYVLSDGKGVARVELPQPPNTAFTLWVTAAGHAPITATMHEGEQFPTNYVLKLPAGTMISGVVVDEEHQPVANVKIEFSPTGIDVAKRENEEFGPDTTRYTDELGRWWSDTIPADFNHVPVLLTHTDFAATGTNVVLNGADTPNIVLTIRKGVLVTGTVTDENGGPIAGVSVRQVENRTEPNLSAKSDDAGHFELGRLNPCDLTLAAQAEGFSPVVLDTNVYNAPVELGFKLTPGHDLRGRVVDESGAPVANAMIKTESDSFGVQKFKWSATTDNEGKFEWKSAPVEPVTYSIVAKGFDRTSLSLKAGNIGRQITLTRPVAGSKFVRLRGTVLDADTGESLDDFKVLVGRVLMPQIPPQFEFATDGRDGQFDFQNNVSFMGPMYVVAIPKNGQTNPFVGPAYQVEIEKDGYAPAVSTNLFVRDGDRIMMFTLHKDVGFSGEVLLPNGDPATNATVYLCHAHGGVYIGEPGKVREAASSRVHTQVDQHGHFFFATTVLNARGFIVIADDGYAEVPMDSFTGKIVLQPWGRVEGKLMVSGQPGGGQTIWLSQVVYHPLTSGKTSMSLSMETTTDNDGSFVFEKVPPGERHISQRQIAPIEHPGRIHQTQEKTITVAPGLVTRVELGGSGRTVTGRAHFAGESANWQDVAAELNLELPGGPGQPPKPQDFASTEAFRAAAQAYGNAQREFWASEKGHEADRAKRSYSAYCSIDGTFSIPDVPPGQYELNIEVREHLSPGASGIDGKEVGLLNKEINVPESEDGKDHEVFDLGTLDVPRAKVTFAPVSKIE